MGPTLPIYYLKDEDILLLFLSDISFSFLCCCLPAEKTLHLPLPALTLKEFSSQHFIEAAERKCILLHSICPCCITPSCTSFRISCFEWSCLSEPASMNLELRELLILRVSYTDKMCLAKGLIKLEVGWLRFWVFGMLMSPTGIQKENTSSHMIFAFLFKREYARKKIKLWTLPHLLFLICLMK